METKNENKINVCSKLTKNNFPKIKLNIEIINSNSCQTKPIFCFSNRYKLLNEPTTNFAKKSGIKYLAYMPAEIQLVPKTNENKSTTIKYKGRKIIPPIKSNLNNALLKLIFDFPVLFFSSDASLIKTLPIASPISTKGAPKDL